MFDQIFLWFTSLANQYNVNPAIFGLIYIGAIPFFGLSVAWIARHYKKGFPVTLPVLCASFFFIAAYLYLFIAGENIPWWVYSFIIMVLAYSGWATYNRIGRQTGQEMEPENG
jgi:hypothetical protein